MSIFVDASVLIAMIAGEADQDRFATILRDEPDLCWSAMVCWEAIAGLRSSYSLPVAVARTQVEEVTARLPFRLMPIGEPERAIALDAYGRYGRGSGHRAKLNMGDCFAYACAKTNDARLLYKGNVFTHTDMA